MKTSLEFLIDGLVLVLSVGIPIVLSLVNRPIKRRVRKLGWRVYGVFNSVSGLIRSIAWLVLLMSAFDYVVLRARHHFAADIRTAILSLDLATGYLAAYAIPFIIGGCTVWGLTIALRRVEGYTKHFDESFEGLKPAQKKALETRLSILFFFLFLCLPFSWPFFLVLMSPFGARFLFGVDEPILTTPPDDPALNQVRISVLYVRMVDAATGLTHNPLLSEVVSLLIPSVVLPILTGIVGNYLYDRLFRYRRAA